MTESSAFFSSGDRMTDSSVFLSFGDRMTESSVCERERVVSRDGMSETPVFMRMSLMQDGVRLPGPG